MENFIKIWNLDDGGNFRVVFFRMIVNKQQATNIIHLTKGYENQSYFVRPVTQSLLVLNNGSIFFCMTVFMMIIET